MDPVLGSVLVALIASLGAIVTAVLTGRNSAERLAREDYIRRLKRRLVDHHGEDAHDVDAL